MNVSINLNNYEYIDIDKFIIIISKKNNNYYINSIVYKKKELIKLISSFFRFIKKSNYGFLTSLRSRSLCNSFLS